MQFRTKIMSVIVVLCVLSFFIGTTVYAADKKVIGKAAIKAGAILNGIVPVGAGEIMPFVFTSFKDQEMYVIGKMDAIEGKAETQSGGYILDATGFSHLCPTHGEELFDDGFIGVPQSKVDDGSVIINLF